MTILSRPTVHSLLGPIIHRDPSLIGIDGLDGCGKSTLANELAGHIHFDVVSIDDFLDRNKGTYVDHIELNRLGEALQGRNAIVEGVCLLKVLSLIGLKPDLSIYVQRIRNGIWDDEDWLGLDRDLDEHLERIRIAATAFSEDGEDVPLADMSTEVIRYHHEYRPHDSADLTFSRYDC
jgi:hypothetical protein